MGPEGVILWCPLTPYEQHTPGLPEDYLGSEGLSDRAGLPLPPDDPRYWDACNLGEVLGLRGLVSLLPLLIVGLGLATAVRRFSRA